MSGLSTSVGVFDVVLLVTLKTISQAFGAENNLLVHYNNIINNKNVVNYALTKHKTCSYTLSCRIILVFVSMSSVRLINS